VGSDGTSGAHERRTVRASGAIAEASPQDRVWGIGLAAGHGDAQHPALRRGLNLPGFALMDVRDELGADACRSR